MKRMIALAAVFFSATVLLAQTKKHGKNAESRTSEVKFVPMNVKTGLWQSTSTMTAIGGIGLPPEMLAQLTPEQRARYEAALQARNGAHTSTMTHKECLTQKDLTTNPFGKDDEPNEGLECHRTVINSTSSDAEIRETCSGEASMTFMVKIHAVDREHTVGTGEGTATMGGHTMKSSIKFDTKWLGATCPAGVH